MKLARDLKSYSLSTKKEEMFVVLLGKKGSGKSITGGVLVDDDDGRTLNTEEWIFTKRVREDQHSKLHVLETPGIWDIEKLETAAGLKQVCSDMLRLMQYVDEHKRTGVAAFLLVLNINERLMQGDRKVISTFELVFGAHEFWSRCIMVLTGGELFEGDFDDWIVNQTGRFKDMITKCHKRLVLIISGKEEDRKKSSEKLLTEILHFQKKNSKPYSMRDYIHNEEHRKQSILSLDLKRLEDKYFNEIQEIETWNKRPKYEKEETKWECLQRLAILKYKVNKKLRGTDLFQNLSVRIMELEKSMIGRKKTSNCIIT